MPQSDEPFHQIQTVEYFSTQDVIDLYRIHSLKLA